jgi:hypothetical protein
VLRQHAPPFCATQKVSDSGRTWWVKAIESEALRCDASTVSLSQLSKHLSPNKKHMNSSVLLLLLLLLKPAAVLSLKKLVQAWLNKVKGGWPSMMPALFSRGRRNIGGSAG